MLGQWFEETEFMKTFRRHFVAAIAFATLLGMASRQPILAAKIEPTEIRTKSIRTRDGKKINVEIGRVRVPENRNRPNSREISVAYIRAKSPLATKTEPVFFLAGGPGGSSVRFVQRQIENGGENFFKLIGGDIVGIDQRGVGQSRPNLETDTKFDVSVSLPGNRRALLKRMKRTCRAEAKRWRDKGVDINGYTTVQSADDINDVRQALGYQKIVLWGGSYGSHLAMATIRRHEQHVARALLTGPEGPNHTHKLPSQTEEGLRKISELVAADPDLNDGVRDMIGMLEEVLSRLERAPVYVDLEGTRLGISKFDVQVMIANAIGTIRGGADRIPKRIKEMHDGEFTEIGRELLADRRGSSIGSVMQMMMDCSSGMTDDRAARIAKESTSCLLSDAVNFPFSELADAWNATDLGDEFRSALRTNIPIQFIVGDLDSRTPVGNAEELMAHMPNAELIVVTNVGHNDVPMGMPLLRERWGKFLRTGETFTATIQGPPVRFASLAKSNAATRPPGPKGTINISRDMLLDCEGEYEFAGGATIKIRAADGRLIGTIPGKGDFDLWPTTNRKFVSDVGDAAIPPLTFVEDDRGHVVALKGGNQTAKKVGVRAVELSE